VLWLVLGKSRLDGGDLESAASAFETARRLEPMIPIVELIARGHEAEIRRREGNAPAAEDEARAALTVAQRAGLEDHPECAVAHLVLGQLHLDAGEVENAAFHLDRGTDLAGRIPYEPRRRLAASAQRHRLPRGGDRARHGAPAQLSERELDVLRLLASSLTQPEIASALYVSMNTLKTHTRSIYQKLGVNSRHTAIERARLDHLV
jgi:LuxR family maltose regulon positive regulatory protein